MVVYAKSHPKEDLKTHIQNLLNQFEILKSKYKDEIENNVPAKFRNIFWDLLKLVVKYHDLGKLHTPFQNIVRKRLKEEPLPVSKEVEEVPHNLLSPSFIKEETSHYDDEVKKVIYHSIAYHHYRGEEDEIVRNNWDKVVKAIKYDLEKNLCELEEITSLGIKIPSRLTPAYSKIIAEEIDKSDIEAYKLYILIKGLLHRLDHSASAHLPVEEDKILDKEKLVFSYLIKNKKISDEKIWQKEAIHLRDKNVVLVASTGIGKTEFALVWLGDNKGFYTLPVRTSVNAMYERIKETFKSENIGLLHSDSYFYHLEKVHIKEIGFDDSDAESITQSIHNVDLSRQLSMPLTVSTADQIFTSVFKYKGYEKIYSTLAYSKVIIDEIQSYDPEIVAIIIKGLQEISKLGGKFCLITATLPTIYLDEIKKLTECEILPQKILQNKKHKIKMLDLEIDSPDSIKLIKEKYHKNKRVLIVVNTVRKAQQLYKCLKEEKFCGTVTLLHSLFIYKDRRSKEKEISKEDSKECIWICTQLVEVSLDIDFPVLFTEIAPVDALIQRMGRILRKELRDYDGEENIFIFKKASGIGSIYDKEITEFSVEVISSYDGRIISENEKKEMVDKVFNRDKLKGTSYLRKFENSLNILELGFETSTKEEAQNIFRKISNLTVIPVSVYENNNKEIEGAFKIINDKNSKREEKIKALYTIRNYSLSIPYFRTIRLIGKLTGDLFGIFLPYDYEIGLTLDKNLENNI